MYGTLLAESLQSFLDNSGKRKRPADIFKLLLSAAHPAIWMSWTNFILEKPVFLCTKRILEFCWLFLRSRSITIQMAAASISRINFQKIIDSTFSKLRRSATPAFRKMGKCTSIWDEFCFRCNHVLSRFYLRELIRHPVTVTRSSWKNKLMSFRIKIFEK